MSLYDFRSWWSVAEPAVARAALADAAEMAELHAAAFHRGWGAQEFEAMIGDRAVLAHVIRRRTGAPVAGFIVSRLAADEAEILSVAVGRRLRGRGFGRRLVDRHVEDLMRAGIARLFLEVEADNEPALRLYRASGFAPIGRRKGYYRTAEGVSDAVTMRRDLPRI